MAKKKAAPAYRAIEVVVRNGIGIVALNRPEVHNAVDATLVSELTDALRQLDADPAVRVIVISAGGESFSAGVVVDQAKKSAAPGRAETLADAQALAAMLQTLDETAKPTVARIHGAALGSGVGIVACCDIAIAAVEATFALSEARLGLIPAASAPYVIAAIGARQARRYFQTGEQFEAAEAYRLGLVHDIVPLAQLDDRINEVLGTLLVAGPNAQRECKALIRAVADRPIDARVIAQAARQGAAVRASPEAAEGVAAFLGKRYAAWIPANLREPR
ncbi:MAG: enoyl-CoA hydratase-related protein [Casimicrobiaceae bacterium]